MLNALSKVYRKDNICMPTFFHCRSIKCAPYFQYNSSMTFSTFQPYDIDTLDNEYTFHHQKFGRNIQLSHKDTIACRTTGYNQAIVISSKPLQINNPIEVEKYTGRQQGTVKSIPRCIYSHAHWVNDCFVCSIQNDYFRKFLFKIALC